jgi:hypothetical protein
MRIKVLIVFGMRTKMLVVLGNTTHLEDVICSPLEMSSHESSSRKTSFPSEAAHTPMMGSDTYPMIFPTNLSMGFTTITISWLRGLSPVRDLKGSPSELSFSPSSLMLLHTQILWT